MRIRVIIISLLLFTSCKKHHVVTPAFYYWKSGFNIDSGETKYIDSLHLQKLYVKFFDVTWNNNAGEGVPEAIIHFNSAIPSNMNMIPVVYVTNKTLLNTSEGKVATLSGHILGLLESLLQRNNIKPKELQFDCDWTDNTRDKYFQLLSTVRHYTDSSQILLTATIRLHQIKYYHKTGIPPIKRGMLMFYNMGDLTNPQTSNSIFNKQDAEKYIASVSSYPLPLDVALPAFTWGVHMHYGKITNLLNNLSSDDFARSGSFTNVGIHLYRADSSFFFHGDYFFSNDLVKVEEISPKICMEAANMIASSLPNDSLTVSLFHLDNSTIKRYETKSTEAIYNTFR